MSKIVMQVGELKNLLKKTQRNMVIAKSSIPQVESCVLQNNEGVCSTYSIVRDGKTSIAKFCAKTETQEENEIVVSSITQVLGCLSVHNGSITLKADNNKLKISSQKRTTTIVSDPTTKAFTHTQKTVKQWSEDSKERFDKSIGLCVEKHQYLDAQGNPIGASLVLDVDRKDLFDALKSASINKQIIEYVKFEWNGKTFSIESGEEIKGKNKSNLDFELVSTNPQQISAVIGGGFENILGEMNTQNIQLQFYDFTQKGAGVSLVLVADDGTVVFQRESIVNG